MLIVHYKPDAPPISDFHIKERVEQLLTELDTNTEGYIHFYTSNLTVINWLRAELYINYRHLQSKIRWFNQEQEIFFNKDMRSESMDNLFDINMEAIETLLQGDITSFA